MKKIVVFAVILTFVLTSALSAQGLGFGVKGGLNLAKFSGEDAKFEYEELESDPGFIFGSTLGGFVVYNLSDYLGVQVELLYTKNGSKYDLSENLVEAGLTISVEGDASFNMNYLEIPLLGVLKLTNNINVFAGPFVELFLNGTIKTDLTASASYEGETFSESESDSEDIESEDINSPGFGLLFGGTYMVTENIGVEARYALGLTSINEDVTINNTGLQVIANIYLQK